MALRDVLLALGAGAGRQAEIGGLMFQDAQKREARDYEYALEKEKWRRSGELKALDTARQGWKWRADKAYSAAQKWRSAWESAQGGAAGSIIEGGEICGTGSDYSDEQIADFKRRYEDAWGEYQFAEQKFMEYSGLEWEATPVEDLDAVKVAEVTPAKGKLAQLVDTAMEKHYITKFDDEGKVLQSPKNFETMMRQRREGGDVDVNAIIDTINSGLEDVYLAERKESGYSGVLTDTEKKEAHLNEKQEQSARKMIMDRLDEENEWAFETTRSRDPYPTSPINETFSPLAQETARTNIIESGEFDHIADESAYNEAISNEVMSSLQGTVADPSIQAAEAVARDRAEEAALAAQTETTPRQGRGMISQGQYQKAYVEAQQMLTQMFQQLGNVSLEQFQALMAEQGLRGIELMAYQQAYKDLLGQKPTGLGFEPGGLGDKLKAGGSIPSLTEILFP